MSEYIDLEEATVDPVELEVSEVMVEAVSPHVSTAPIAGGTRVTITDIDGSHEFDLMDGEDGDDGVSPTVSTAAITGGTRVTITDGSGDHAFDVMDGEKGDPGASPTVSTVAITGGTRVTITDGSGDHAFDVMNGLKGDPADPLTITGTARSWGVTDTPDTMPSSWSSTVPTVEQGKYLWSRTRFAFSDGTVAFATSCARQGVDGGRMPVVTVSGTTPSITGVDGSRYICGTVSTITITPPASGCIDIVFTSGTTPALLTATGVTWPEWFDATALEAGRVYEINIADGFGAVMTWPT